MKLVCLILFVLVSTNTFAGLTINDPGNLLGSVDTYINSYDFDSAFSLADKSWYEEKNCTFTRDDQGNYSANCETPYSYAEEIIEKTSSYARLKNISIDRSYRNFSRYMSPKFFMQLIFLRFSLG